MIVDPFELRARPELVRELRREPGRYPERRYARIKNAEVRQSESGVVLMGGLAAVYDKLSVNLGGFREKIARGFADRVLADNPDVRALFNHDINYPLARTTVPEGEGSLRIKSLRQGLDYEYEPTDTSYARDLAVNMRAGVITQSSFAFRVAKGGDEWEEDEETGALIRTIHEISDLYDVSPVTDPAYPQTDAGLRSFAEAGVEPQPSPVAEAPEPGDEGDHARTAEHDEDPTQGDQDFLAAARQRALRMRERQLRSR